MLKIRDLRKSYGALAVLDHLSLDVGDKEIVAVMGPSGCGKSTMLNIVAGFVPADSGTVDFGAARLGYVFQEDRLLPWRTVAENIALVRDDGDAGEVERLVGLVGLGGFSSYPPDALSGGMRQRCSIARAYYYHSDLLLMDEPFKSLDHVTRLEMLRILMAVRRTQRNAILFITHDVDEALAIASRIVVMGKRPSRATGEFSLGAVDKPRDIYDRAMLEMKAEILRSLA